MDNMTPTIFLVTVGFAQLRFSLALLPIYDERRLDAKCSSPSHSHDSLNSSTKGDQTCVCEAFFVSTCGTNQKGDQGTITPNSHPLDPLTAKEISTSTSLLKASKLWTEKSLIFSTVSLMEPPKANLIGYYYNDTTPPKGSFVRRSLSVLWEKNTGNVYEGVVDLDDGRIERFGTIPEKFKLFLHSPEDSDTVAKLAREDTRVMERIRQLGITNMDLVSFCPRSSGIRADLNRPFNVWVHARKFHGDNEYAHPLPFMVVVDLIGPRVVSIEDLPLDDEKLSSISKPESSHLLQFKSPSILRSDDKPIVTSSPWGTSYKLNGNLLEWQDFKFRLGFNAREGLVIYNVLHQANSSLPPRPILHRASISHVSLLNGHRKTEFDTSQEGIGFRASPLDPFIDCLGDVTFLSYALNNNEGDPVEMKNAVCIYEDDAGTLWRHQDGKNSKSTTGIRSHRLNVMMTATIGNFDYILTWSFHQDASIKFSVKRTGQLSTYYGVNPKYGTLISPEVVGPNQQHLFALRLDMDVDGVENTVVRKDAVPTSDPAENPYGNGFSIVGTPLTTQAGGVGDTNPNSGRNWVITNPSKLHPYAKIPVGWKLVPAVDAKLLLQPDSPIFKSQIKFANHSLWVTRHKDDQLFAAGTYLNQDALGDWIEKDPNVSIANSDVVLWHTFKPIHFPRAEDFPVMSFNERVVWLKPHNFFIENPGIDVPPSDYEARR